MIRKVLRALGQRAVTFVVSRLRVGDAVHLGAHGAHAGEVVAQGSVLALSTAWACVNLLVGTQASLPCMVYRTNARGARVEAKDHPAYRLVHDSPNADQTALDFWEYMCAAVELWGNAYAQIIRSGGRLVALLPIDPEIVTVKRNDDGELRYRWTEDGEAYDLGGDEMLHIRGFGGNPLGGVSTLTVGRHVFGLAQAIDRSAGAMFRNGLRPSVALTFDKWLTDEQRNVAESKLVSKFSGAANTGRPMVLEGGTKIETLSMKPEDAQMLESRAFSVEEVCRMFGVPPFMVGHTEKTTSFGRGLSEQVLGFQKFTLRRRLKRIEQALMKCLLTPEDRAAGVVIEFNLEALLRGDSAARAAFYNVMLANGVMTINEVRALENLSPIDGGDVPRIQSQNVPIGEVPAAGAAMGHNGGPPLEDAA